MNEGRWEYNFTGPVPDGMHKGTEAYAYSYSVVSDYGYGEVKATYTFYIGTVRNTHGVGLGLGTEPVQAWP